MKPPDLPYVAIGLAISFGLAFGLAACPEATQTRRPLAEQPPATRPPSPAPTPQPRFTVTRYSLHPGSLGDSGHMEVICDTATGHLLYGYGSGAPGVGLAVIPNGCARVELRCITPEKE